ncbi:MAG: diiron oxygenase [Mycobacteriaceae bacterium]|nr:diiron oxygenase [Mycobacteriaceae bacterium]
MTTQSQATPRASEEVQAYEDTLRMLSAGSVRRHFDPYVDIDWDSPDFAVDRTDRRWILPASTDPLGSHPWYLALPEDRKIQIGLWRQANVAKVGLQFEQLLIGGVMNYVFKAANGSPEFRYLTHECIEECNHTLMFQEMVNRIGDDVPGMGPVMNKLGPLIPLLGRLFPTTFFVAVLAGEEPIDHIQKSILRAGEDVHPIMQGVMRIHIAEEARHISFAHEYLQHKVPKLGFVKRGILSLAFPIVMYVACNLIVRPPRSLFRQCGIPMSVRRDLFWGNKESKAWRRDLFGDVRMLAQDTGLLNPVAKLLWKALRIDGKPARFRGEPVRSRVAA